MFRAVVGGRCGELPARLNSPRLHPAPRLLLALRTSSLPSLAYRYASYPATVTGLSPAETEITILALACGNYWFCGKAALAGGSARVVPQLLLQVV